VELALKTVPGVGIRLVRNPIGEIASLRTETRVWLQRTVSADPATNPLSTLSADTYELQAEFDLAATTATEFGFQLHRRANGSSDVQLAYNTGARTLAGRPLEGVNPAGRLKLRVLVDRGQLEVFGNDGVLAITDNVNFDAGSGAQGLAVYARDGTARLVSLTFHRLGSIWSPTRGGNTIRPAAAAGKCVDRDVASGIVQVWDCNGVGHQYWTLGDDGSLSTAGSCMQTAPGETANFTLVQVAACIGGAHEKWRQDGNGAIIHQASGRCLDVRDADYANGRQLQIHDCVGSPNQQWKPLVHVPGTGRLAWSGSNACVDRDVASGRVQIWQCLGGGNQAWTPTASGSLSTDTQNGKVCMQLPEGQTGNHALVNVAPCTGRANQAWSRNRDGSWMNIAAGRCLDLDVGDTSNGRQLQVWDCIPGGGNQRWDWRPWP
jgi:fructan beta-fructosidase